MPKSYYVTIPYCCSVSVLVTVDEEIENADQALDAAMEVMDGHHSFLQFVKINGDYVPEESVSIGEGQFLKRIASGNVMHASFNEIDWEETDG